MQSISQAGLDLWGVRGNRTEMQRAAMTASRAGCFSRISTEIRLVLTPIVDDMQVETMVETVRTQATK